MKTRNHRENIDFFFLINYLPYSADSNIVFTSVHVEFFSERLSERILVQPEVNMPIVKEWKASYYHNSKSKWLYGTLSVYPAFVHFVQQQSGDRTENVADFRIYFDEFTELKKETTTIFYAAITIRIKEDKFWFSSFQSRSAVFNVIEHFWRERLFGRWVFAFYLLKLNNSGIILFILKLLLYILFMFIFSV